MKHARLHSFIRFAYSLNSKNDSELNLDNGHDLNHNLFIQLNLLESLFFLLFHGYDHPSDRDHDHDGHDHDDRVRGYDDYANDDYGYIFNYVNASILKFIFQYDHDYDYDDDCDHGHGYDHDDCIFNLIYGHDGAKARVHENNLDGHHVQCLHAKLS